MIYKTVYIHLYPFTNETDKWYGKNKVKIRSLRVHWHKMEQFEVAVIPFQGNQCLHACFKYNLKTLKL